MLGNRAARDAALDVPPLADRAAPDARPCLGDDGAFVPLGRYSLPDGPIVALYVKADQEPAALAALLAPLSRSWDTAAPTDASDPDCVLHYAVSGTGAHALWRNRTFVAKGNMQPDAEEARGFNLVFELIHDLCADRPPLAILHGAAVEWRDRRIVFMGRTGSGKSTLAAMLTAEGAYLGDDYVVLLSDGRLRPLPLAPSIKQGAWNAITPLFPALGSARVFSKGQVRYKLLGAAPYARDAGPADLLVFPRFSREARPKMQRLTDVETYLHLAEAGLWLPMEHLDSFMDVMADLPCLALRHTPDLDATRGMLAAALDDIHGQDTPIQGLEGTGWTAP